MKRYYLDTNALYALANYMDKFTNNSSVNLSLLNIKELISKVKDEKDFIRRREVIRKIKKNNLNIYPYLPIECVAKAFKLDISEIELIENLKVGLWKQMKIMADSDTLDIYIEKLKEEGVDLFELLEFDKNKKTENFLKLNKELDIGKRQYNDVKKSQEESTKYTEIDIEEALGLKESKVDKEVHEKKKKILTDMLNDCNIYYTDEDLEKQLLLYDGELTAFLLGIELYCFARCSTGKCAGKNDLLDITHLLYLRNENDIIVSDDKIFDVATVFNQKIGIEEFKKIWK